MKTLAYMHTHLINEGLISELGKIKKAQNEDLEVILFINNSEHFIKNPKNETVVELEFYGLNVKCLLCDEVTLKALNLPLNAYYDQNVSVGECFWFNCDYSFYIVRHFFTDFDFYWQIQYDVFYNDKDYISFFDLYKENKTDLLITKFRKENKDSEWVWIRDTQWLYNRDEIYGSLWTVIRMRANLIDALYLKRLEHNKNFQQTKQRLQWPLCELFATTECIKMGFSADKLQNDKTSWSDEIDLNIMRLFDKPDQCLYHPIMKSLYKKIEKIEKLEKMKKLEHFSGFMRFYINKKLARLRKNTYSIYYSFKRLFRTNKILHTNKKSM